MSGKVGRNTFALANDARPFVCEIFGGEDGVTVSNNSIFADNAAATFPLSGQPVDPAYSQLCSVEIALARIGDEAEGGDVSTTCDAVVTDVETGKTKNMEPGGNYFLEVPMGQSVPQFSVDVAPGSIVVVCGMFCSQVSQKSLQAIVTAGSLLQISDVKGCIAEALDELPKPFEAVGKDGEAFSEPPVLFDLKDLSNPERGPVADISCEEGAVQVTYCDKTQSCFRNKMFYDRAAYNSPTLTGFDQTVEEGTVFSPQDGCIQVDGGKCGNEVKLRAYHSYNIRASDGARGSLNVRPEINVDGAGWVAMQTGGTDELRLTTISPQDLDLQIGEISFDDCRYVELGPGSHDICFRFVVLQNQVTAGTLLVVPRSFEMTGEWHAMIHCDPIAAREE